MNFTWDSILGSQKSLEKLVFEFDNLPDEEIDKEIIIEFEKLISDD